MCAPILKQWLLYRYVIWCAPPKETTILPYVCSDKVLKSCRELCKQPALKRLYYMIMLYRLERLVFW